MERELKIERILRWMIVAIAAIGALTILVGTIDIEVTTQSYATRHERAGGPALTLYVIAMLVPGIWALYRPRWAQIVFWIMSAVSVSMVGGMVRLGTQESYEMVSPVWPPLAIFAGVAALFLGICVALPFVRALHKAPALPRPTRLPVARLTRR